MTRRTERLYHDGYRFFWSEKSQPELQRLLGVDVLYCGFKQYEGQKLVHQDIWYPEVRVACKNTLSVATNAK